MRKLLLAVILIISAISLVPSMIGNAQYPGHIVSIDSWELQSFSSSLGTCGITIPDMIPGPQLDTLTIEINARFTYGPTTPTTPPRSGEILVRVFDGYGDLIHEDNSAATSPSYVVDAIWPIEMYIGNGIQGPLTVGLIDMSVSFTTPVAQFTFNPADYEPSCAATASSLGNIELNEISTVSEDTSIFLSADEGNPSIDLYGINEEGEGYYLFSITEDLFAPFFNNLPAENTEILSVGDVTLYILTTGEYQLNIGPDEEGKVRVIIFEGLPPTNIYSYDFNVYDILDGE